MGKIIKELIPIKETHAEWDEIEKRIKKVFKDHIYLPVLEMLKISISKIHNATNDLLSAVQSGKVTYSKGYFRGKFNSAISRELRKLGAKWDTKLKAYKIIESDLPYYIQDAIHISLLRFEEHVGNISRKLEEILPEDIADKVKVSDLFDSALHKVETDFQKSINKVTIAPHITDEQRVKIADEWQNNMDLFIRDFTEKQIKELRKTIQDSIFSGNRYESLISGIKSSYDVTDRKAKFLARQETNLLMTKYKETRYVQAGVHEYRWGCVKMPHDTTPYQHLPGNVRFRHGELEGQIFRWDDPPITSNPGEPVRRNNPGTDYNCVPGESLISFDGAVNKVFRRRYSGELTQLVTDDGTILNATANHSVLTDRGWLAMKDVNVGDQLFFSSQKSLLTKEVNGKDMISSAEDIFNALSLCSKITSNSLTESDFHGDIGIDKEVDIISVDRELILDAISQAYEELHTFLLQRTDSSSSSLSTILPLLQATAKGSFDLIGLRSEFLTILAVHGSHPDEVSFGARSDSDSGSNKPSSDSSSTDPKFFGYSKLTHPILVILNRLLVNGDMVMRRAGPFENQNTEISKSFTNEIGIHADYLADFDKSKISSFIKPLRVINKFVRSFTDHIYNFETSLNWYFSEGFIIHNCRCYARPIIKF